jgi:DNA invertase Pin-like site-specific DNA recombinase
MALIGYARVSTGDQNTESQLRDLEGAGCERLFVDQGVSGTKASRPELDKMLDHLRSGDVVVVWKLDRLGRNTRNTLEMLDLLHGRGVGFQSLRDGIKTDPHGNAMERAMAEAMLTIISAFSQLERDTISERTRAGLETARAHGRHGGRPEVGPEHPHVRRAKELRDKRGWTIAEICKDLGKSRATVHRYLSM